MHNQIFYQLENHCFLHAIMSESSMLLVNFFFMKNKIFFFLWFLIKNDFQNLTSPWWDGFLSGGVCWTPPLSYKTNASIQTGLHFFYFSINCLSGVRYNSEEKVWRQVHYIANLRCTVHVRQSQATFVLSRSASLTSQKPDQYHFNWTNAFTWHFIKGFVQLLLQYYLGPHCLSLYWQK